MANKKLRWSSEKKTATGKHGTWETPRVCYYYHHMALWGIWSVTKFEWIAESAVKAGAS